MYNEAILKKKGCLMGGFAGGDEGGYWEIDNISSLVEKQKRDKLRNAHAQTQDIEINGSVYSIKAHAKIDIFFKVTGEKDGSITFQSRCMRVENLYDTVSFVPCKCESFTIEGCDTEALESNSIYKAYTALTDYTADSDIVDFFHEHKVVVTKRITSSSLGGDSSDAAAFIRLVKGACNLILSTDELVKIGREVDNDLAFFIYNYPVANVSGFGEIVECFEEKSKEV